MPVNPEPTPNPNALKFTIGKPVGGPKTYVHGEDADDPAARQLLALPGITSVFMTADFVTISKTPEVSWDEIAPRAQRILEEHYQD